MTEYDGIVSLLSVWFTGLNEEQIRPTRCHLVPVPEAGRPKITSIVPATPTTFITGDENHLIQLWRFRRQGELLTVDKVGDAISDSHSSAISSIAIGRNDTLWSAAGRKLLGTDIRSSRTVFGPNRRASSKITQLHFHEDSLLLEVFVWFLLNRCLPTLPPRRQTWIIHSDYMIREPPLIVT